MPLRIRLLKLSNWGGGGGGVKRACLEREDTMAAIKRSLADMFPWKVGTRDIDV